MNVEELDIVEIGEASGLNAFVASEFYLGRQTSGRRRNRSDDYSNEAFGDPCPREDHDWAYLLVRKIRPPDLCVSDALHRPV